MMWVRCALAGGLLLLAVSWPAPLHADTVRLVLQDGLVTLDATDATAAEILEAWSREGGVAFVNAERVAAAPITVKLENVPEGEALDIILRPVSGYLARRRVTPESNRSLFDRIVILATPATAREVAPATPPRAAAAAAPVFPQPPRSAPGVVTAPRPGAEPAGIQQEPGVVRLVGPDGQPVPDDQEDAPPAQNTVPPSRPQSPPGAVPNAPPMQQPPMPTSPGTPGASPGTPGAAPVGVPRPGMVVPAPSAPGQPPNTGTTPRL